MFHISETSKLGLHAVVHCQKSLCAPVTRRFFSTVLLFSLLAVQRRRACIEAQPTTACCEGNIWSAEV